MRFDHTEIPISVLTGVLGSGKTTLLNGILHGDHEYRMGVIVNEFGQVDIDSRLVRYPLSNQMGPTLGNPGCSNYKRWQD